MSLIGDSLRIGLNRVCAARHESRRKPRARRPRVVFFGMDAVEPDAPRSQATVIAELRQEVRAWSMQQVARPRLAA